MKKFCVLIVIGLLGAGLAGCDQKNEQNQGNTASKASENTPAAKEREAVQQTEAETKPAVPETGISTTRAVPQTQAPQEPVK